MISNKYVAIDLGSSAISALAAEVQPDGALKILGVESKPSDDVKHGIVEHVSGAAFKVNELVKWLQNSSKIPEVEQVCVSIGARSMKHHHASVSRFVGASHIVSEQLIAEMHDECEKKVQNDKIAVFDVIPLSYELDGLNTDEPVGKTATQITGKYCIIYGNKIIADELYRCFDRTGLKIEHSPIASEALSTAVLEEQEREDGCALINFGASTTSLSIYKYGALQQLLVVPLGGKNITKDIQELGINEQNAERLKCLKGTALERLVEEPIYIQIPSIEAEKPPVRINTQFLATIIESRLEEIMNPIVEAIKNYPEELGGGIIVCGGASKLNNLIDFITEKTGIYARFGNHTDWLIDKTPEKYHDPVLSQLIGTILLTHEYRELHPVEIEQKSKKKQNDVKIPKKGIKDRLANGLMTFFGDENSMD